MLDVGDKVLGRGSPRRDARRDDAPEHDLAREVVLWTRPCDCACVEDLSPKTPALGPVPRELARALGLVRLLRQVLALGAPRPDVEPLLVDVDLRHLVQVLLRDREPRLEVVDPRQPVRVALT